MDKALTVAVPLGIAGQRHYVLIDCWNGDQEITVPAGWRLDREYRWFNRGRYKALVSHVQTDSAAVHPVTISLKNDTPAVASVVLEDQIEGLFVTLGDMVTGERLKAATLAAQITKVLHHDCAGCGEWVKYVVHNGNLYFDPSCGCGWTLSPEYREWQEAADWINMHSSESARLKTAERFGLTLYPKLP